ncbi:hypothetical protein CCY01nite_07640 [Chitinophaga cymbidii]|uniref:Uncharacterized protein n=2 Tax=Chitinophaga cymbidii TaxID=1096750 RepID=A0A512RFT2_9BACT|nr:hypothetical protein CCY01nite_07640 [Chitinophaga cymbidii]
MEAALVIVIGLLVIYYWFLYRKGILKPQNIKTVLAESTPLHTDIIPRMQQAQQTVPPMSLPPAADHVLISEPEDETGLEILEDEDTILLKEAENIVDKIQDTINHIASQPPNPEEVSTKIRSIVQPYQLLLDTEYFDSINTYIALSVERDCGIKLTTEEIQSLWN